MGRVFANLIEEKRITFDAVPEKNKAEVLAILKERGIDAEGNPIKA